MCLRREKGASRPAAAICSARSDFSAKPVITFFGWAGTALMAVTVVALLWSSFGRTGSGRVFTNTVRVRRCATVREMKEGPSSSAIRY